MSTDSKLKPRKLSSYGEEDIIIKPSTELIADEYEHFSNENVLLHMFESSSLDEDFLSPNFFKTIQDLNYKIDRDSHLHYLTSKKSFEEDLELIKEESINKSALVLIFNGFYKEDGTFFMEDSEVTQNYSIKTIWNKFSSNNCPQLKNKPKIFIFCLSLLPELTQVDSKRHSTMDFDKVYDFPAEADILIIYEKFNNNNNFNDSLRCKQMFLNNLCNNIKTYSKKYDIVDLFSYMQPNDQKAIPLIISTLTRKFYLTPSNEREHYLSITENNSHLEETLKKIKEEIQKLQDVQNKKKDKNFSSIFKKKTEEKSTFNKKEKTTSETPKSPKLKQNQESSLFGSPGVSKVRYPSESTVVTDSGRKQKSGASNKKPTWRL